MNIDKRATDVPHYSGLKEYVKPFVLGAAHLTGSYRLKIEGGDGVWFHLGQAGHYQRDQKILDVVGLGALDKRAAPQATTILVRVVWGGGVSVLGPIDWSKPEAMRLLKDMAEKSMRILLLAFNGEWVSSSRCSP